MLGDRSWSLMSKKGNSGETMTVVSNCMRKMVGFFQCWGCTSTVRSIDTVVSTDCNFLFSRGIGYIGLVYDPLAGTELGEALPFSILHWCRWKWLRCAGQRERARESENGGDLATHWMANSCFLKTVTCLCHNTNLHRSFRFACKSLGHAPNHLIPTWQCIKFEVMCSEV